jgi:MoaA/NifB/PqqE/SkfB family radical SAM enzyme
MRIVSIVLSTQFVCADSNGELTDEQIQKMVGYLVPYKKIEELAIGGGELFLRNIVKLFSHINRMIISLTTNGIIIDQYKRQAFFESLLF